MHVKLSAIGNVVYLGIMNYCKHDSSNNIEVMTEDRRSSGAHKVRECLKGWIKREETIEFSALDIATIENHTQARPGESIARQRAQARASGQVASRAWARHESCARGVRVVDQIKNQGIHMYRHTPQRLFKPEMARNRGF